MKILRLLAALCCAPILLAASFGATEETKEAEANKPSLTYYYFDG